MRSTAFTLTRWCTAEHGLRGLAMSALAGQMDCRASRSEDMFAITLRWPVERR